MSTKEAVAGYLKHSTCELYLTGYTITAYVPTKATCETKIEIGPCTFIVADQVMRALGLEPTWN